MARNPQIAIIGAGHNGLVCACYLAKEGYAVTIYERRAVVGGLCITEELLPGVQVSSIAGFYGMLRKEIIADLELYKRGLEPYYTEPPEIVVLPGNQFLYTPRQEGSAKIEIGRASAEDLQGWSRFWNEISRAADLVYAYQFKPETTQHEIEDMLSAAGLNTIAKYIFQGTFLDLCQHYFTHPSLLAAASTCVIGFPDQKGTTYSCLHMGTAQTLDAEGAWGMVKGGMGEISQALLNCAQERGVRVIASCPVKSVALEGNKAVGVILPNGSVEKYDLVISNADPVTTFTKLVERKSVPDSIKTRLNSLSPAVSAGKIHFVLDAVPPIPALASIKNYQECIICLAISFDQVMSASKKVQAGLMPDDLMLTILFNSLTDPSLAPPGKHLLSLAYHWLPSVFNGQPWDAENKKVLLEQTIATIERHCPTFRQHIVDSVVIAPGDLQNEYSLQSMDCWHLPMTSEWLMENRRFGDQPYSTPFENFYICGAGTYPAGNVTGAPGFNCARQIIDTLAQQKSPILSNKRGAQ